MTRAAACVRAAFLALPLNPRIERGRVDINVINSIGNTALHRAAGETACGSCHAYLNSICTLEDTRCYTCPN